MWPPDNIKEIDICGGEKMLVSLEDWLFYTGEKIYRSSGGTSKCFYAYKNIKIKLKKTTLKIHQEIWKRMGNVIPKNFVLDHIDLDGLHNFRENLRLLTLNESMYHRSMQISNTSGFIGVYENNCKYKQWRMKFQFNGLKISDSYFTKEEAIQARLNAEEKHLPFYLKRQFYIQKGIIS